MMLDEEESSMKIGASLSRPKAREMRSHSLSSIWPRRNRCESTPVSMARTRCTSCSADISRLNTTNGFLVADRRAVGHAESK